ncbi:single-stranded DNA-binding protein [Lacrimispora celerecrescens]|uniref:Single-stranded DNA-binding protein n=1 Tax=[Clostridium] celerecrescens 18A TaxID=1286362 RepID=A0A2M8Z2V0_9FIRM|nr:single-stranded DNA-binding protein [Lacrimispora celerecrescens]PJJ27749.1 single-stranded DNA-binding protein [[Clostridium] celerecrescens 18A]
MNTLQNNSVTLIGEVDSGFTFSHEVRGEAFYLVNLAVKRLSEQADIIPLTISERLIDVTADCMGRTLEVAGQFRSFNQQGENKKRLILSVFVRDVFFLEEDFTDCTKSNSITLKGYLCKSPVYRKTPLGREIADLLLAVNRSYNKSDYIPCIAWGRNAKYASGLFVGTKMEISGRIQSREYTKKLSETDIVTHTAYEVSVSNLEVFEND